MRYSIRIITAAVLSAGLIAALAQTSSAQYSSDERKCRSTVAKGGSKLAKTALKAMTKCHQDRDKNGGGTNCNNINSADPQDKVDASQAKFETTVASKCSGNPGDLGYGLCPVPCDFINGNGTILTFSDLVTCLNCLGRYNTQLYSDAANGTPSAPITDEDEADCHKSIIKNGAKLYNAVVKDVTKCQSLFEKGGSTNVDTCTDTGFVTLTQDDFQKYQGRIYSDCAALEMPGDLPGGLDPCGGEVTPFALALCVAEAARNDAQVFSTQLLDLPAPTTTTTTTTTLPGTQDPLCPDHGELVLYSKISNTSCTDNVDCAAPRTCDTDLGKCTSVTDLDTGWNGLGHNGDINDGVRTRGTLFCPGGAPVCGQCLVTGIDPSPGNCRCTDNGLKAHQIRQVCDEPFQPDFDDCGGDVCDCYFGPPFPLSAGGTPVCVSNRFSSNITGTANVDEGSGAITAQLRTQVFNGITKQTPCPVCGGQCSDTIGVGCSINADCLAAPNICDGGTCIGTPCVFDTDCTSNNCVQDIPGDGNQDGVCTGDSTSLTKNMRCEVTAVNASFPAVVGATVPGSGGGGYSLDCQPAVGRLTNGEGIKLTLTQTTGTTSLTAGLDCDADEPGTDLCPCLMCSKDDSVPCTEDSQCAYQGSICAGIQAGPATVTCNVDSDCEGMNVGPCGTLLAGKCDQDFSQVCTNNTQCKNVDNGPCQIATCSSKAQGDYPKPNNCAGGLCEDLGQGEGKCETGPNKTFCDGLIRADGTGLAACSANADCGFDKGDCTLIERAPCFLDPIVATGDEDPQFPVGAAIFCIGPVPNTGINIAAGLLGPGRVVNQAESHTFCASNNDVEYTPGVGGCPAP